MQGLESKGARLLSEIAALLVSLAPAKRERVIGLLRDLVASLEDDPASAKYCNRDFGRASL